MRAAFLSVICASMFPLAASDPPKTTFWSAAQLGEIDTRITGHVDPDRHLGSERLMDSAFVMYRVGPSEAEIHDKLADFIIVRSGEGAVLAGGTIVEPRRTSPEEQRGKAIEGGTRFPLTKGDTLYVPANTVHQFLVEPGKNFTALIVKVTPKP